MSNGDSAEESGAAAPDAPAHGVYYFLDVGGQKYGECTLVRFGQTSVLIDGAHESDFEGQAGYRSIPEQLEDIFGRPPPFDLTLVVVTHCHADHVGCLPDLLANDVIKPKWALITDPGLGFGRSGDDDAPDADLVDDRKRVIAAALREEDASDLQDADLRAFIDAVATVESRYTSFVNDLASRGVKIVRYQGDPLPSALARLVAPARMKLLGPSQAQLLVCAEQISGTNRDAADAVERALRADADLDDVDLYREVTRFEASADAGYSRGSAMNCQSITLAFGPPGARVLLAGDMQFTAPGVRDAADEVAALRRAVAEAGPYRLFKTTHHTSHNGQDEALLAALGDPPLLVHSGGRRDAGHPDPATLQMLKGRSRRISLARTDRNGLVTVRPHRAAEDAIEISKGRLNDFTDNGRDVGGSAVEPGEGPIVTVSGGAPGATTGVQVIIVNLPAEPVDISVGGVDIVVRRAYGTGAVTPPSAQQRPKHEVKADVGPPVLAAGRALPPLLFVTNGRRLGQNIGRTEASAAMTAIRDAGHVLCEVNGNADAAVAQVRRALRQHRSVRGVVIAGGYDVVPCPVVDVLTPRLRNKLGALASQESDGFVVWCDEPYGDVDADNIAETPVSRITDARDSALFMSAFQAKAPRPGDRFGVRNVARPFADAIWTRLAVAGALKVSEKFTSGEVAPGDVAKGCHYYMLHGDDRDASVFTGECVDRPDYVHAFDIRNVPPTFEGLVFAGCCWGALTVSQKARDAAGAAPAPRVAERSIALAYLKAGASAFVGCTGAHYSGPDTEPDDNFAVVLHEAFWSRLPGCGFAAAPALFAARAEYGRWIAEHGADMDPLHLARRLKNHAQFTCLGLGW